MELKMVKICRSTCYRKS